jgi:hypothetical protein
MWHSAVEVAHSDAAMCLTVVSQIVRWLHGMLPCGIYLVMWWLEMLPCGTAGLRWLNVTVPCGIGLGEVTFCGCAMWHILR